MRSNQALQTLKIQQELDPDPRLVHLKPCLRFCTDNCPLGDADAQVPEFTQGSRVVVVPVEVVVQSQSPIG